MNDGGWLQFTPHPLLPGLTRMAVRGIGYVQETITPMFDLWIIPGMTEQGAIADMQAFLDRFVAQNPGFRAELDVPVSPH